MNKKITQLVFVCSGAADVGALTNCAARQLAREGTAAMSCLASVGARDHDIMFNANFADDVLLIDGCPKACSRRTFEHAGLRNYLQFDLSEVGLRKGSSPVTPENLQTVARRAAEMLAARKKK